MRVGLIGYYWKRQWKLILLFFAIILVVSMATNVYYNQVQSVKSLTYAGGGLFMEEQAAIEAGEYAGVNELMMTEYNPARMLGSNYAVLANIAVIMAAILIATTERRFLTSLSVSRWEYLLTDVIYMVILSLVLSMLSVVLGVLDRCFMWAIGYKLKGGWTVGLVLFGDNANWLTDMLLNACNAFKLAGLWTLFITLWQRWWKPILVLMAIGVVLLLLLYLQAATGTLATNIVQIAEKMMDWVVNVLVKFIEAWVDEPSQWIVALRNVGLGLAGFALAYPVCVRMKLS